MKILTALTPALIGASLIVGCNPEPSVFQPRDFSVEPEPPVDSRVDQQIIDMAPEIDAMVDMQIDMMVDAGPPPPPPAREETIVLTNRDDGYVGWVQGDRLYSARFEQNADAVGDVIDVGDASSLEGRLRGYRLTGSRPYVVLPSGENSELQAHDLTGRSEPANLGLWPPFELFIDGEVLLVGQHREQADADAEVVERPAWRIIQAGNRLTDVVIDQKSAPLPRTAARAIGGWVMGFGGPTCLDLTRSAVPEAPWFCQGRPGARLLGDSRERLVFMGPTVDGLRMWQAMPGVSAAPEGEALPALRTDLTTGSITDWLPPPSVGQLVQITEDGDVETLWWLRANQTQRAVVEAPESILGLSVIKSDIRLMRWDAELNRPVPAPVDFAAGPTPPVFEPAVECNAYAAETCGDDDLDCNAVPNGGLCCRDSDNNDIDTRLPDNENIDREWFAGVADVGLLLMVRMQETNEARLYNHPRNNVSGDLAGQVGMWPNVTRLKRFDNRSTRIIALADTLDLDNPADEGMPPNTIEALLWFQGVDGPATSAPPCDAVRDVTVLDAEGRARVWCADQAFDLDSAAEAGEAVAYPEGTGTVQWIERNAFGQDDLFLVAHGDDHTLALWSLDENGAPVIAEQALPMAVTLLTAEERTLPIRLPVRDGGYIARAGESGALEVVEPGVGWKAVPAGYAPYSVSISRFEPVAISVAFSRRRQEDTIDLELVDYFIHSLQAGTQPWGQRYRPNLSPNINLDSHRGAHFGNFPSGPFLDPIFIFANGGSGGSAVSIEATQVPCEP